LKAFNLISFTPNACSEIGISDFTKKNKAKIKYNRNQLYFIVVLK
jgi:hypothetical protein